MKQPECTLSGTAYTPKATALVADTGSSAEIKDSLITALISEKKNSLGNETSATD